METSKTLSKSWLVLTAVVSVLLISCVYAQAQGPGKPWKWPNLLSIGSRGVGTSMHITSSAWAPVLEETTGMKVRVMPEDNAAQSARFLNQGMIELSSESEVELAAFIQAEGGYPTRDGGPFQIRVTWIANASPFSFIVRKDSPIKTIYDIKPGAKLAKYTAVPSSAACVDALVAWIKLDGKVTFVPCPTWKGNVMAPLENRADVAYANTTSPVTIEAESTPPGIRWLELNAQKDPEGAKRFLSVVPTKAFGVCTTGVKPAIGVSMNVTHLYYFAKAGADDDLIYHLAEWMDKNYAKYAPKHPNCETLSIKDFRDGLDCTFLPVHEGTIRYLKEKGMWTAKDEARQKFNVKLLTRYEEAYKGAKAEADKKKTKIDPTNKEWIELWNSFKKDIPVLKVRLGDIS